MEKKRDSCSFVDFILHIDMMNGFLRMNPTNKPRYV